MIFEPNEKFAKTLLNQFIEKKIVNYSRFRNFDYGPMDRSNVSLLSPFINHQTLIEIDILKKVLEKYAFKNVEKFIDEVFWRTYWRGWMESRPQVWEDFLLSLREIKKNEVYQSAINANTDIECFNRWVKELKEFNYLHNHARMWFASIWIFTLRLPWQLGAEFFLSHLLDGDSASNTLSWRWVAGLQTKGKNYLAKNWNIEKFTNKRFTDTKLNENALPIREIKQYQMESLYRKNTSTENKFLLIFDNKISNDVAEKFQNKYKKCFVVILKNQDRNIKLSDKVIDFKESLAKDIFQNSNKIEVIDSIAVKNIMNNHKSFDVIYPYRGENYDFISNLNSDLNLKLNYIYDDYDLFCWQFSDKSFFNFRKNIPRILAKFAL